MINIQDNRFINFLKQAQVLLENQTDPRLKKMANKAEILQNSLGEPPKIVVGGQYNAGKSSFINVLLKEEILPTNVNRETITQNWLVYGSKSGFEIHFEDETKASEKHECTIETLATTLNEKTKTRASEIDHVCISHPYPPLKHFTIIDTPGFNFDEQDDVTALRILEKADVLIWIILAEKFDQKDHNIITNLLKNSEEKRLQLLKKEGKNDIVTFGVINQIDSYGNPDRDTPKVEKRVKEYKLFNEIFSISCKWANQANSKHLNDEIFKKSGFSILESALERDVFTKYEDWRLAKIKRETRLFRDSVFKQRKEELGSFTTSYDLQEFDNEFNSLCNHTLNSAMVNEQHNSMKPIDDKLKIISDAYEDEKEKIIKHKKDAENDPFIYSEITKRKAINILTCAHKLAALYEEVRNAPEGYATHLEDCIEDFQKNNFKVGVFGGFSTGKSTFLNTFLKTDNLLPVDEDRCTSVHTILRPASEKYKHGSFEIMWKTPKKLEDEIRVLLDAFQLNEYAFETNAHAKIILDKLGNIKNRILQKEHNGDQKVSQKQQLNALLQIFPSYASIQKKYNTSNNRHSPADIISHAKHSLLIHKIIYYLNNDILSQVELTDSPGTGSINLYHTQMAKEIMRQSDAIIMITEASTVFERQDEIDFLNNVIDDKKINNNNLFILVNKLDLSKKTPDKVIASVKTKLNEYFEGDLATSNIFPISSTITDSNNGIDCFKDALHLFLKDDKEKILLDRYKTTPEKLVNPFLTQLQNEENEVEESLKNIQKQIDEFNNKQENLKNSWLEKHLPKFEKIKDRINIEKKIQILDKNLKELEDYANPDQSNKTIQNIVIRHYKQIVKTIDDTIDEIKNTNAIKKFFSKKGKKINDDVKEKITEFMQSSMGIITTQVNKDLKDQIAEIQQEFTNDIKNKIKSLPYTINIPQSLKRSINWDEIDLPDIEEPSFWSALHFPISWWLHGDSGFFQKSGKLGIASGAIFTAIILGPFSGLAIIPVAITSKYLYDLKTKSKNTKEIAYNIIKTFNRTLYDKDKERMHQELILEIEKNIIGPAIHKVCSQTEQQVADELEKIEKHLKHKLEEKKKGENYKNQLIRNRQLILTQLKVLKTDYQALTMDNKKV